MSLEWESKSFSDLVDIIGGGTPKTSVEEYWNGDIPWISIKDFNSGQKYVLNTEKTITELGLNNSSTKLLKKNDIIISARGTVGEVAMIKYEMAFNQSCYGLKVHDSLDKEFVYYLLKYNIYKLKNMVHGAVFDTITTNTFDNIFVNVPPLEYQEKISYLLSNIDKLVEVKFQENKNLFEMGQIIFNEYVINKYEESSSNFKLISFSEISTVQNGFAFKSGDYCESGCNMIRTKDITASGFVSNDSLINLPQEFYDSEKYDNYKFERLDTITVMVGASIGKMGLITDINIPSLQNQNMWRFRPKSNNISPAFVYYYVKKINKEIINMATGSARSFYRKNLFLDYECILPDEDNLNKLNIIFNSLFNKISENVAEIDNLIKLRDTLLPKLMSGEIDVSKINCDMLITIMKVILILLHHQHKILCNGDKMKTKIISKIQNQMKPYLNQGQYIKLTNSLLDSLQDIDVIDNNNELSKVDNFKLLDLFLSAKQVEGCSNKTIKYYESTIEKMLMEIKKQVYNINTDDLRKYLFDHKNEKHSSKTTIDNIRRIFSSFFSWLEDEDYILKNPVRRIHRVKTGRVVKEVLTDENLEILRDNCEEIRDLAIVELLTSTGIRVGELVNLNIEDIDFYERECVVFGKGESERIVYFDARTKIHLLEYLQSRIDENPALFVSLNSPYERLGISGVETRLRELGKKCNINKVHPHKFRRTMATNAIDKGMPIEQVQKLLGHVQIDTTMQYAMVNQSNVKLAHRKFIG